MGETPPTIGGLLNDFDLEAIWFEMGRRVQPLGRGEVLAFEAGRLAYPYPLLRKAWLGVLFWSPDARDRPSVWFFKLGLDELGLLDPATRDDFLGQLQSQLTAVAEGRSEHDAEVERNPYAFAPSQERLAMFHAQASKLLGNPCSRFYEHARAYFAGEVGFDQWRFLGLQGVADVVARIDQDGNSEHLAEAIPRLPAEPFGVLCSCLEHQVLPVAPARALAARLRVARDAEEVASVVRGISQAVSPGLRDAAVREALGGAYRHQAEVLAAIVNRAWESVFDDELRGDFLEALAENTLGQELFDQAMLDLSYLPGMRAPLLGSLRAPTRSAALSAAVGNWFRHIGV